jgi:hypothetical protein
MKASACLAISDFLWCISATVFTSPMVSPEICQQIDCYAPIKDMRKDRGMICCFDCSVAGVCTIT